MKIVNSWRQYLNDIKMELAGKVIEILEARKGQSKTTGNNWMVQSYVIEFYLDIKWSKKFRKSTMFTII